MRLIDRIPLPPMPPAFLRALPLTIRHWLRYASSLLPGTCALCGASGRHVLCGGCRQQFFPAGQARCICCALPLVARDGDGVGSNGQPGTSLASEAVAQRDDRTAIGPDGRAGRTCGACLRDPPSFDATVAATNYAAPVEQLVLGLKFGARLALAPLLAELLRDAMLKQSGARPASQSHPLPDLLCPVPLGPARLRERGFNQALEMAGPLGRALGVPVVPRLLVRLRDTPPQSRLSPQARRLNLRDAFLLQPALHAAVRGRHVGVVDDVMTTGETLDEIAALLHRFGATRVTNLVFARTLPA